MKLNGIHHITAITADAQRNVDFYAGVLGLRMVKKTVNQDEPSVYHLFYADEQGSPGADMTFFEFPGRARRTRGRRDDPPDRLAGRSDEALDFWEQRLDEAGAPTSRTRRRARLRRSGGPRARAGRRHGARPAADRGPSRGPGRAGAPGLRPRARLHRDPERSRELLEQGLEFEPVDDGWEVRGPTAAASGPTTRRRRSPGIQGAGTRPPHRLELGVGRPRGLARACDRARRAADAGDRPVLVPLDLLPRAERRAVRARDARARLRRRRGPRAPRREADPAAVPRGPARGDREGPDADHESAAEGARRERPGLVHLLREPAGEPEGALVLNHGRGTDEHDLFGLLDELDPERRLLGVTTGAPLTNVPPGGRHWYLVPRVGYPDPTPSTRATRLLTGFLDELLAERGIGWERTVIGGFSMGAVMSYAVALGPGRPVPGRPGRAERLHPDRRRLAARARGPRGPPGPDPPRRQRPDHLGRVRAAGARPARGRRPRARVPRDRRRPLAAGRAGRARPGAGGARRAGAERRRD